MEFSRNHFTSKTSSKTETFPRSTHSSPESSNLSNRRSSISSSNRENEFRKTNRSCLKIKQPMKDRLDALASKIKLMRESNGGALVRNRPFSNSTHPYSKSVSTRDSQDASTGPRRSSRINRHEEQMDWEPFEVAVVSNVQTLRRTTDYSDTNVFKATDLIQDNILINNNYLSKSSIIYVVVDTNVLISHLNFVKKMVKTGYIECLKIIVVIPWLVLTELDGLKNFPRVGKEARNSSSYLLREISNRSSNLRIQPPCDPSNLPFKIEIPDDNFLICCLQIIQSNNVSILLSNDNNLRLRAESMNIPSVNAHKLISLESGPTGLLDMVIEKPPLKKQCVHNPAHKLAVLLKKLLSSIIEIEYQSKYKEVWKLYADPPPPWNLKACFQIIRQFFPSFGPVHVNNLETNFREYSYKGATLNRVKFDELREGTVAFASEFPSTYSTLVVKFIQADLFDGAEPAVPKPVAKESCRGTRTPQECIDFTSSLFEKTFNKLRAFCNCVCETVGKVCPHVGPEILDKPSIEVLQAHFPDAIYTIETLMSSLRQLHQWPHPKIPSAHEIVINIYTCIKSYLGDLGDDSFDNLDVVEFCCSPTVRNKIPSAIVEFGRLKTSLMESANALAPNRTI